MNKYKYAAAVRLCDPIDIQSVNFLSDQMNLFDQKVSESC